jgi:hypothetical protein
VPTHPEPAAALRLLILRLKPSRTWIRIHPAALAPLYFGREPKNRFDAPAGEFGVLYMAADAHGAFIETFGHETGARFVTATELAQRGLAVVTPARTLRLVDLRGNGLARMGADAALASGLDYHLARRWALAIHDHPRRPDGILYRARHDPGRMCAAIFDRAGGELAASTLGTLRDDAHRRLLGDILDTYGFGLIP